MTKRPYVADVTAGSLMIRAVVSVRTLPLLEEGSMGARLVGVVTRRDLTRALID
jgi:CBS-domain-containing membrane protein